MKRISIITALVVALVLVVLLDVCIIGSIVDCIRDFYRYATHFIRPQWERMAVSILSVFLQVGIAWLFSSGYVRLFIFSIKKL